MPTNKKQKRVSNFNDEVTGVYTQWLNALDHKSAIAEALCLYKELPEARRTEIAQEVIDVAMLKRMQQDTGVTVLEVKEDEESE
jgi:hypothetical protein|tara:strand:+ start:374 stop:625 length:252 start_codon:yes stop_codon:yes gene_type:complete